MRKDKLDEIREKLKLDSLDDKIKKEMFNKFVDAGGKVVDLNKKSKKHAEKMASIKKNRSKNPEVLSSGPAPVVSYRIIQKKRIKFNPIEPEDNPINKWIERFSAKLGCYFSGIISFDGESFKNSFRDLLIYQYQNNLLNSRMILASVLYQDKLVVNEIKKASFQDSIFPYNYELIYRFDNLYNPEIFDQLVVMRHSLHLVKDIQSLLLQLFKSILVIQPYYVYLKTAIEKALITEKNIRNMDPAITYDNLKKLYGYVDFVFLRLYPRLFSLIDWYYKNDTKDTGESYKDYLKFSEEDVIGYYTNKWKAELAAAVKKDKHDAEKKSGEEIKSGEDQAAVNDEVVLADEDPIKKGLEMIENNIKLRNILANFSDQHDIRSLFPVRDRVFITLCIVDYFDKEFSFIINSNKVGLNIAFVDGKRSDLKRELMDTYYKINLIMERVNEYLKVVREIKKLENDSFVSFQERTTRSNQYSLQRSQISRTMRKDARELFEEFSKKLLIILGDYQGGRKIIENPDETLQFDTKIDGTRYADGKKIIELIGDAYNFSCAALFLLTQGDLSSFGLIMEKSMYLHMDLDQVNGL